MFRTLRGRLLAAYITLIISALLFLSWLLIGLTQNLYLQNLRSQLVTDSRLVTDLMMPLLSPETSNEQIDALAKKLKADAQVRVTVIRSDGVVLGDSDEWPAKMENHADRPEVIQALATGEGESTRFSHTLQRDLLYVARRVQRDDRAIAVVRVAVPLSAIDEARAQVATLMLSAGLVISLITIAMAIVIAQRTTDSLAHLSRVATRLASGELQARARPSQLLEVKTLAAAMNQMADTLSQTIYALQNEQARMAAILAHMGDGLLLVDAQQRVIQLNRAAEKILDILASTAEGQSFTQLVHNYEMAECLRDAQTTLREQTRIVEQSSARRFLRMVATPLTSPQARTTFLVILQDLTEIRRLETVRRDFITNISHELRTPLASMQALVETLNNGALEDVPMARHFVAQLEDEVHHLVQLVNDLLDLSAVESGQAPLQRRPVDISQLVQRAAERLQPQAARAGLTLKVVSAPYVELNADEVRIEHVLLNLIHNAIKFTPSGGSIECRVEPEDTRVSVCVRDTGIGISPADLPRIFERFYKADKARTRGGTGLGLALAKHIIELHGGNIWAESSEGQGTTMMFTLPLS